MRLFHKILVTLVTIVSSLVIFYVLLTNNNFVTENIQNGLSGTKFIISKQFRTSLINISNNKVARNEENEFIYVWLIFTKAKHKNSPLKYKLRTLLTSLFNYSSVDLWFNIICDDTSKLIAAEVLNSTSSMFLQEARISYYNLNNVSNKLSNLISTMQPYFTSSPGSYYSDALFFISLGLYLVAPKSQKHGIMLDIDTKFKTDIKKLNSEFLNFSDKAMIGIAPELTPVYQHILYSYRSRHKNSRFGKPLSKNGFPGVNSGVLLLDFKKLRDSEEYQHLLSPGMVKNLTQKYLFKGHLGDQDFYTIIGMEFPHFLHLLPCQWNRQLCQWWSYHGYRDVFDQFSACKGPVLLYHGNCNTPIPRD